MNDKERAEYIAYRSDRARETLDEARVLIEASRLNGAVNRIYYAMFYAVSALALANAFSTSSHAQLRGYFNREFVKTGRVPVELGKVYRIAFDSRTKGDYDDLVRFEKDQVSEMLSKATDFVQTVTSLVNV